MWKLVREFVRTCDVCARAKAPRHRLYGLLHPLPIPNEPWASISMDFITNFPCLDLLMQFWSWLIDLRRWHILFLQQRQSQEKVLLASFLITPVGIMAYLATLYQIEDPSSYLCFGKNFLQSLGLQLNLSLANHPQTDGQTKRVNQVVEQYLQCTVNYHQDNWVDLLPLAKFAYNNTCHSSIRHTPFFVNYGRHPKFDTFHSTRGKNPAAKDLAHHLANLREELTTRLQRSTNTT